MRLRILIALSILLTAGVALAGEKLTVSAAASLKEALSDVAVKYEKETGTEVELNLGASGQLAAQIDAGAPVDAIVSAGEGPIRTLEKNGKIDGSRVVAGNHVVLIVPAGKGAVSTFEGLTDDSVKRVAIGRPKVVPAGDYAAQVLERLGIADKVKEKLVYGQNVRQVLDYVARGEVDAGIVYSTDAIEGGGKVSVVATADEKLHDPVRYLAAVVKGGKEAAAGKFVDYLSGPTAQETLRAKGFVILPAKSGSVRIGGEK
jgi:molybdate transport system substrate-binding protein